jgi:hypothetical protein
MKDREEIDRDTVFGVVIRLLQLVNVSAFCIYIWTKFCEFQRSSKCPNRQLTVVHR